MEHTSDTVYDGKLLHESSYSRRSEKYTELELGYVLENGMEIIGKIDFYDHRERIIHEIKRSDKVEGAHVWQCKFYIWLLLLNGVDGAFAVLEYPKLRQVTEVRFGEVDQKYLKELVIEISRLIVDDTWPSLLNKPICKSCSYFDLCYIGE